MATADSASYSPCMRYRTGDATQRLNPAPEEIILEGWLEDVDPYIKLEVQSSKWKVSRKHKEAAGTTGCDPGSI